MEKKLISPQVYTFETDKSELIYRLSNGRPRIVYGSDITDTGSSVGGGLPANNEINYLLLENGFYLLQEDGSKIII